MLYFQNSRESRDEEGCSEEGDEECEEGDCKVANIIEEHG
jgi:hypothetical protein